MSSFTFKWPHAAEEVFVTGTFDNWSKSAKLEKTGDVFEKSVDLPDVSEKIYYKFVVDGTWTTDHTAPQEKDESGNENNVLKPGDFSEKGATIMNSVGPDATTAKLAGDVPLEKHESVPGTFPETPAAELDKEIKVDPLPAAPGGVFPVKLAPGEPIPDNLKAQDVNSNVTLDKESYEKSGSLPDTQVPPVSSSMIPESSLPIVGANDLATAAISTVGPQSTTVGLAGAVPLEAKVPEVVKESQEKAGVDAEASGDKAEVEEKAEVEQELLSKVPEAPSTSEGTAGVGTEKSEGDKTLVETVTATATAAGAAALAAAVAAKDAVLGTATQAATNLPDSVKDNLPAPAKEAVATETKEETREEVSPEVPAEVKESIAEAGKSPEAAANTAAVEEKKAVEAELLKEVRPVEAAGESSKAAEETKETKPAANGTEASPAAASNGKAAEKEKKKKNRLSAFLHKIRHPGSSSKDGK